MAIGLEERGQGRGDELGFPLDLHADAAQARRSGRETASVEFPRRAGRSLPAARHPSNIKETKR